jgi:hypothetical protein
MLICINSGRIPLGEVLTAAALSTIADKSILIRRFNLVSCCAWRGRLEELDRLHHLHKIQVLVDRMPPGEASLSIPNSCQRHVRAKWSAALLTECSHQ